MALAMQQEIVRLNTGLREPFSLRIGIAAGPVVAGVIGTTKFAFDVWGQTVDAAAQMEAFGLAGAIQVTADVYHRLRDRYLFEERGSFYVEGIGEIETYLLKGKRPRMQ
jgi:class 3 adenylate cyclase